MHAISCVGKARFSNFYLRHAYVEGNCLFQEYWSGNDNFSFGEENKQRVVKTIVAKMNHSSYC